MKRPEIYLPGVSQHGKLGFNVKPGRFDAGVHLRSSPVGRLSKAAPTVCFVLMISRARDFRDESNLASTDIKLSQGLINLGNRCKELAHDLQASEDAISTIGASFVPRSCF